MVKKKRAGDGDINGYEESELSLSKIGEKLINTLNNLSTPEFRQKYLKTEHVSLTTSQSWLSNKLQIDFKSSAELTKDELDACFGLIETTSRSHYASSGWGWHPRRKKREMKEDEIRYLIVRSTSTQPPRTDQRAEEIQGFLSFMLTHDSSPPVPVLYVYEVHLASQLRSLGLGAHLMQIAEDLARDVGVEKVMLTCFICNEKAYNFYEKRGYAKDVVSPEDRTTRNKAVKADHAIMSKSVPDMPATDRQTAKRI